MIRILLTAIFLFVEVCSFAQGASRRVDKISDLIAINPQAMATAGKLTYAVGGYYTNGDWGSDRVADWEASSSATTNTGNIFTANVSGRWIFRDRSSKTQDVRWFGVKGDNVTDDTRALTLAINYCNDNDRTLVVPKMTSIVSGTINVRCNLEGSEAQWSTSLSNLAPMVRISTNGSVSDFADRGLIINLPYLYQSQTNFASTNIGLETGSIADCKVTGRIYGFKIGVYHRPVVFGQDFCQYTLTIIGCETAEYVKPEGGGWWNSNQNIGGSRGYFTGGERQTNIFHTIIDSNTGAGGGSQINNNVWLGTAYEGAAASYFVVTKGAAWNSWLDCRWEASGGSLAPRIKWGADSSYGSSRNLIRGGYVPLDFEVETEDGSVGSTSLNEVSYTRRTALLGGADSYGDRRNNAVLELHNITQDSALLNFYSYDNPPWISTNRSRWGMSVAEDGVYFKDATNNITNTTANLRILNTGVLEFNSGMTIEPYSPYGGILIQNTVSNLATIWLDNDQGTATNSGVRILLTGGPSGDQTQFSINAYSTNWQLYGAGQEKLVLLAAANSRGIQVAHTEYGGNVGLLGGALYPSLLVNSNGVGIASGLTFPGALAPEVGVSLKVNGLTSTKATNATPSHVAVFESDPSSTSKKINARAIATFKSDLALTPSDIIGFEEEVDDRVDGLLVEGTGISISYNDAGDSLTISSTASGTSVGVNGSAVSSPNLLDAATMKWSASGTNITAYPTNIQYAQIQNLTAERLLGRTSASAGSPQEITAGDGLVISGTTLSADFVPGANVTFSTNVSGQITIASTSVEGTNSWQIGVDGSIVSTPNLQDSTGINVSASGTNVTFNLVDRDWGDVTTSGTGTSIAIDNDAVTYAKIQNVSAASRLLGRGSAGGAGDIEEITLGSGLTLTGTTLTASGSGAPGVYVNDALVGDANFEDSTELVWSTSGTNVTADIALNSVGFDKVVTVANNTILGRYGGGAGNLESIAVGSQFAVSSGTLKVSDSDKGDLTVSSSGTVWTIDNGAVSYAKIQDASAASVLLGRGSSGGSGDVQEITLGTGLSMSGTTLSATAASSGPTTIFVTKTNVTVPFTELSKTTLLGAVRSGQSKTVSSADLTAEKTFKFEAAGTWDPDGDEFSNNQIIFEFGGLVCTLTTEEAYNAPTGDVDWSIVAYITIVETGSPASNTTISVVLSLVGDNSGAAPAILSANSIYSGALDTGNNATVNLSLDNGAGSPMSMTCNHAILTSY